MTRHRSRRARGHHPVVLFVCAIVALAVGRAVLHLIGLAVVAVVVAGVAYLAGQRTRPVARVTSARTSPAPVAQLASLGAERDQLRAEAADLRRQLADARASAEAAWDASAGRAPSRRVTGDTTPLDVLDAEKLGQTPMSGARSLGPR